MGAALWLPSAAAWALHNGPAVVVGAACKGATGVSTASSVSCSRYGYHHAARAGAVRHAVRAEGARGGAWKVCVCKRGVGGWVGHTDRQVGRLGVGKRVRARAAG